MQRDYKGPFNRSVKPLAPFCQGSLQMVLQRLRKRPLPAG